MQFWCKRGLNSHLQGQTPTRIGQKWVSNELQVEITWVIKREGHLNKITRANTSKSEKAPWLSIYQRMHSSRLRTARLRIFRGGGRCCDLVLGERGREVLWPGLGGREVLWPGPGRGWREREVLWPCSGGREVLWPGPGGGREVF